MTGHLPDAAERAAFVAATAPRRRLPAAVLAALPAVAASGAAPLAQLATALALTGGALGLRPMLDLDYPEDSTAEVDANVVRLGGGGLVEVQGTGEGGVFSRGQFTQLLDLAEAGIDQLSALQKAALGDDWPWTV